LVNSQLNNKLFIFSKLKDLILLTVALLLVFTFSRIIFLYVNSENFFEYRFQNIIETLLQGVVLDFYLIAIINSLFVVLFLYPSKYYNSKFYQTSLKLLYVLVNSLALLVSLYDVDFFRNNGTRLDGHNFIFEVQSFFKSIPEMGFQKFLDNYVFLFFSWITMIMVLNFVIWLIRKRLYEPKLIANSYKILSILLIVTYIAFIPFYLSDHQKWIETLHSKTDHRLITLVQNNPYQIIQTLKCDYLPVSEELYIEDFNSEKKYPLLDTIKNKSVRLVVIQTESGQKIMSELQNDLPDAIKYKTIGGLKDDIFQFFDEALLGFPEVLGKAFYKTPYSFHRFESLPEILRRLGYNTTIKGIGIDEKTFKLIQNFYGFSQITKNDESTNDSSLNVSANIGKNSNIFELYIIKFDDKVGPREMSVIKNTLTNAQAGLNSEMLNMVYILEKEDENSNQKLNENLMISCNRKSTLLPAGTIISQPLDLMPTILHYLNYPESFISYGSSLFSDENKTGIDVWNSNRADILSRNLILRISDNESKSLFTMNGKTFSDVNLKDSLVVAKIKLENIFQSVNHDFQQRLKNNRLFLDK